MGFLDKVEATWRAREAGHDGPVEFRDAALASVPGALQRWCEGMDAEPVESFTIVGEWAGGEHGLDYYIIRIAFETDGRPFRGEVFYRGDHGYGTLNSWPAPEPPALSASDDTVPL
ncbi:hypothetical protein [Paenarthrobacter sp. C1]|uniref:hypothetical protein n=1 Tax=Paenarthrobacter sp. C1 TaxID=3400220 RepID=UPI003BF4BE5F